MSGSSVLGGAYRSVRMELEGFNDDKLMEDLIKCTDVERQCTLSHIQIKNVERWNTAGEPDDYIQAKNEHSNTRESQVIDLHTETVRKQ
jgi:hypothetical protein